MVVCVVTVAARRRRLLSAVGRVLRSGRSLMIRVPVDVARDSTFPLVVGDEVQISIDKDRVVVQKLRNSQ